MELVHATFNIVPTSFRNYNVMFEIDRTIQTFINNLQNYGNTKEQIDIEYYAKEQTDTNYLTNFQKKTFAMLNPNLLLQKSNI